MRMMITWQTEGLISQKLNRLWSFLRVKLQIPISRPRFSLTSFSISFHTPSMSKSRTSPCFGGLLRGGMANVSSTKIYNYIQICIILRNNFQKWILIWRRLLDKDQGSQSATLSVCLWMRAPLFRGLNLCTYSNIATCMFINCTYLVLIIMILEKQGNLYIMSNYC